jgi:hypothetical protein
MASLHDIAPAQRRVLVPAGDGTDQPVDVRGLSLQDVSDLVARFPEVIGAFSGGMKNDQILPAILKMGPAVIAAVIAYACGAANDEQAEKVVATWPIGTQAEILAIVVKQTAPRGVGPFVDLLKATGLDLNMVRGAAKPEASSPKQSRSSAATATG